MALIRCPECGKNVSDTCTRCIHCGYLLIKKTDSISNDLKVVLTFTRCSFASSIVSAAIGTTVVFPLLIALLYYINFYFFIAAVLLAITCDILIPFLLVSDIKEACFLSRNSGKTIFFCESTRSFFIPERESWVEVPVNSIIKFKAHSILIIKFKYGDKDISVKFGCCTPYGAQCFRQFMEQYKEVNEIKNSK